MPEMNYKELPVDETSIVPTESEKGQESGHDVADFEKLFQAYFSKRPEKENAVRIKSLVQAVQNIDQAESEKEIDQIYEQIQSGVISGSADDYHNAAVSFSRRQQNERAVRVCKVGLKKWPDNIDLNADALTYAMDAGLTDELEELAAALQRNCPDRSRWNWRGFRFLFLYYIKVKPDGYEEKTKNLIEEYKKYIPADERAYMCEYERYQGLGKPDEAVQALEEAVTNLKAPQCALTLADIYFERADYDDAIRTATLGIAYAAEPQPGIRTSYLLMLRAMAKDAALLRKGNFSDKEVQEVLKEYKLAQKYVSIRERRVIDLRIDILQTYASLPE